MFLENKTKEGVNNNPFESNTLYFMFTNLETATKICAQLNSPLPFFSKSRVQNQLTKFMPLPILISSFSTASQVDVKKLDIFSWF